MLMVASGGQLLKSWTNRFKFNLLANDDEKSSPLEKRGQSLTV
jgi:hypothetical protein